MTEIQIDSSLKAQWPDTVIGSVECQVQVEESNELLREEINTLATKIEETVKRDDISKLHPIREGRKAYKTFGKDPARYRLSSESLLRRIVNGKGLFFVNNIVEINNLVSIHSGFPICAFDLDQVKPPIRFTLGTAEDEYYGIGRGLLNIENLPVFDDLQGKFGSPTSDSERVKITSNTKRLSMNIVSFSGNAKLRDSLEMLENYLKKYGYAKQLESCIIT